MMRGNASSMSPPVGSGTSSSKVRNRNASSQGRKSQTGTRSCHRPAIVLWHAGQLLEPVLPWPPSGPVCHGATERGSDELMPTDTRPLCDVDVFCSGDGVRPTQSVDLSIIGLDGERHIRQRRLLNQGFSPRMIRTMEDRVRQVVTEVLDRIAARGSCDFVADIAVPVPLVVIAELMGLPVEDRDKLGHWSDRMMGGEGRTDPADPMTIDATEAFVEYVSYVTAMVEDRRTARRAGRAVPDDVISILVGADEDGVLESSDELTHDELTMFLVVLLVAGNETTRNAIPPA